MEPQEYNRNITGIYLPGSLYSIIFLLYSWGSLFGVPSKVPLISFQNAVLEFRLGLRGRDNGLACWDGATIPGLETLINPIP